MITTKQVEETRRALYEQREKLVADLHSLDGALQILNILQPEKSRSADKADNAHKE